MATSSIRINQVDQAAGTPGVSRNDLVLDKTVTCTDTANGAGTYAWTLIVPGDSSTAAAGEATDTLSFTPDVAGTYLVYLDFNGEATSYTLSADDWKMSSQGGAAILFPNGYRIPGIGETDQFDGWAGAVETKFRSDSVVKFEDTTVSGGPHNIINFKAVGGGSVEAADAGSGEVVVTISGGSGGGGSDLSIEEEGVEVESSTEFIDFVGASVTATASGTNGVRVEFSGSSGGSDLSIENEGVEVEAATTFIDFVGEHVTATASGVDGVRVDVTSAVPSQGDYIIVTLSTNHNNVPDNAQTTIAFDTVVDYRGSLGLSSYQLTGFIAGRTYMLVANMTYADTAQQRMRFQFYDATAAALVGKMWDVYTPSYSTHNGGAFTGNFIFAPTEDSAIEVVCTDTAGGLPDIKTASFVTAIEIGAGPYLEIKEEGTAVDSAVSVIDFVGDGVAATASGTAVRVEITGGGGGSELTIKDEGAVISAAVSNINFAGEGVVATVSGSDVRVQIDATGSGGGDHASGHITGGEDEIDGDQLDIDWDPSNYTPSTSPSEVTSADHLTAHLQGIDTALASTGGGGTAGAFEYLDTINVTTATGTVTFGASGNGVNQAALDGNDHGTYFLKFYLKAALSTSGTVDLLPNGISTNQKSMRVTQEYSSEEFTDRMAFACPSAVGYIEYGTIHFEAPALLAGEATQRVYRSTSMLINSSDVPRLRAFGGFWSDTTTNITSLEIAFNPGTAGIDAGSVFELYRLTTSGTGGGVGAPAETFVDTVCAGTAESYTSTTPLVVSQFEFDPLEYSLTGAVVSLEFRAVAASNNGDTVNVRLYSLTDGEYVGSGLTFTSTTPTKTSEVLTIGGGAGEVDNTSKMYETRIWATSSGTVELGSARLRVINTIS